jgi:hypothetical protein
MERWRSIGVDLTDTERGGDAFQAGRDRWEALRFYE